MSTKFIIQASDLDFLRRNAIIHDTDGEKGMDSTYLLPVMVHKSGDDPLLFELAVENLFNAPVENVNKYIQLAVPQSSRGKVSDGYHTFDELYEHRCLLWIFNCAMTTMHLTMQGEENPIWRSKKHSDDSEWDGWFLLGFSNEAGGQITYHLPIKYWDKTKFAVTFEKAPEFDGHTPADVISRITECIDECNAALMDDDDMEGFSDREDKD